MRRRRSAMSPVASSSVLRPHTPGFSPMSGFSPTSRRHSITTVPPPLFGAVFGREWYRQPGLPPTGHRYHDVFATLER